MSHSLDKDAIAYWHFEESQRLSKEAKKLQSEADAHYEMSEKMGFGKPHIVRGATNDATTEKEKGVTIETLREYLKFKGGRVNHVAAHFEVDHDVIQKLIDAKDSGIVVADRGWLKLAAAELQK